MKAVILCAGKGTRIREITDDEKPKPMIEVNGKPMLEYIIENLSDYGVKEVLINLHYKGGEIEQHFGDSFAGLDIEYYWEDELLGTAGALNQMKEDLNDDFLVVYGDIVLDLDLDKLSDFQKSHEGLGTILVYRGEDNLTESSIIDINSNDTIERFIEKPDEEMISDFEGETWTNAGVYCLSPDILKFIDKGKQDFAYDVFPKVLNNQRNLKGYKMPEKAYWREVGNPKRYRKLKKDIDNSKIDW